MVRVVGMNSRRGAPMDMDIAAAVWMTSRISSAEDSSVMRTVARAAYGSHEITGIIEDRGGPHNGPP